MEKLTNIEIITLHQGLSNASEIGGNFGHAVGRNLSKLEKEVESIKKQLKASKQFLKFEEEKRKIHEKFAERENGSAKTMAVEGSRNNERMWVLDKTKSVEFDAAIEKLKDTYKEAIEERDRQIEEYREFLEKESDFVFEPYMIKESTMKDKEGNVYSDITGGIISGINKLIEWDK